MAHELIDVLVVGGGAVGACAASLLARGTQNAARPMTVVVLEPRPPERILPGSPLDARVVAVSRASERILAAAGAWPAINGPRVAAYERMVVWHEGTSARGRGALVFDAGDAGEPDLGHIVEARAISSALLSAFGTAGGRLERAELVSVHVGPEAVKVETTGGVLMARLVIGADGADSAVRVGTGLTAELGSYRQTAIIANVSTEKPHESTAWQRFMRDGTLAFLPLAYGLSSIVWSADDARAAPLQEADDAAFAHELDRASDGVLGATRVVSDRVSFPLRRLRTPRRVAQRIALVGDAAQVVHPLAGQGVNLGLLDAASLAQTVLGARAEGEDPGALRVLRAYERWRKSDTLPIATAIDVFDRYLAHGRGPAAIIARSGLALVNRSPETKRIFIHRALGLAGELPQAARMPVS
jgi:2-octaprenylphenol hydroxylase